MNERTLCQMEVHPLILQKRAFRNTLRAIGEMISTYMVHIFEERKKDQEFLEGKSWVGSTVRIRMPQRFVK